MSEIYKRSLGLTYNEDDLRRELDSGTAGHDTTAVDVATKPLDVIHMNEYRDLEAKADMETEWFLIETQFSLAEETMREVEIEHPKYTRLAAEIIDQRLDDLKEQGHPVDAEMYIEAQALAEEIVATNPDKDAFELSRIVIAMVDMVQTQYKVRQYALAA